MVQADPDYRFNLIGGVAVFCDPPTYPSQEEVRELKEAGYVIAIGLHPKRAQDYRDEDYVAFQRCLEYEGVTVLGEVGLDYSVDAAKWEAQHVALDRILQHLHGYHVLVLHGRGVAGQPAVGYTQLLYQLKDTLPSQQWIHLHCFEGKREMMERWAREFLNTYFGFTGHISSLNTSSWDALRRVPEDRLLLETNSPYFHIGGRHSTPELLGWWPRWWLMSGVTPGGISWRWLRAMRDSSTYEFQNKKPKSRQSGCGEEKKQHNYSLSTFDGEER